MTIPADVVVTTYADGRVVYRRGTIFAGTTPTDSAPYISNGIVVPSQGWWQNWTDRTNCPLVVKRTPADLVAANRMFPFGDTGCAVPPVADYIFLGPMDNAGVEKNMPGTGERPDLGWTTDAVAKWMLGGSPDAMLAWAQAADSVPINYVDENTGKPISKNTYPQATTNTYQGMPLIEKGSGNGWTPEPNHFPSLTFAAFEATKDVGLLYNLQHAAGFSPIYDAYACNATRAIVNEEQTRQLAWGFRNLFEAHTATKDAEDWGILPSDLHPSSDIKNLLDQNLAYYTAEMSQPVRATSRVFGFEAYRFSPWQVDYLSTALALGILTGHSDWAEIYLWQLGNVIARTSNASGYPPGLGTMYRLNAVPGGNSNTDPKITPYTWAQMAPAMLGDPESGVTQAQLDKLAADPLNGGVPMANETDPGYMMTTRAALIMADYLDKRGIIDVRARYPQLDACLSIVMPMFLHGAICHPRVSVISGGIIMPTAVAITLGQKVHLDVTFVGPKPPSPPTYTQSDATVGALSSGDMAGVLFTSTKLGKSVVTAATTGVSGPISASCEVTVNSPLPTTITLTPGTIS